MNLATLSAISALTSVTKLLSGGTLGLYSGTQPSTPETGLSGNTLLAAFTFASPAFLTSALSGGYEQQTASFSPSSSVAPGNNGTVTFARATVLAPAWTISTGYTVGKMVTANSNLYIMISGTATSGTSGTSLGSGTGPTGVTSVFQDSTCYWSYVAPSSQTVVADFTVGTSGTDIIIGNNVLSTTINVTITQFILQIPAV